MTGVKPHQTDPASPHPTPNASSPPTSPSVSVIIPVLNEARHLRDAVSRVLAQDWEGSLQIVLAVGPSVDGTADIAAELAASDDRITVIPNPSGRTPDALNAGLAASHGDVIIRVDGHAEIPVDYVATAIRTLEATGADNVGGVMDAQGTSLFERAVAVAMKSPVGVGMSRFHTGGPAGPSDTVYLGVFRRSALERVGGYDPRYSRAQDWELNHRIRSTGGLVYFTPEMRVTYRPRATIRSLAKQYFMYGRWRRVVARHHAGTINTRYLAAPAMVITVSGATLLGVFWPPALSVPLLYVLGTLGTGVAIAGTETWPVRIRVPAVLATMHWSWGVGFLTSPSDLPR